VPFDPVLAEPCFPPVHEQDQAQEEALQAVLRQQMSLFNYL